MGAFYQIGWSTEYERDLRLEVNGELSGPVVCLRKIFGSGKDTHINMTMGEAMRLHSALEQVILNQRKCEMQWREPDRSVFEREEQDDQICCG